MKKFIVLALALSLVAVALFGCAPANFKGEWIFKEVTKVELSPELSESELAIVMDSYNVDNQEDLVDAVFDKFVADETFKDCYLKFDKSKAYSYDPLFERETTWAFYQLSDTEAFLSIYTELDASNGNPYPVINPSLVYNAQDDTMTFTFNYANYFLVTVVLTK